MEWKEHDGKVWNVMGGLEWCRNDGGASEMDLAKFYVTGGSSPVFGILGIYRTSPGSGPSKKATELGLDRTLKH